MKHKYAIQLCLLVLLPFLSFAQQWGVSYVPHYRNVNDVTILGQKSIIAIGGHLYNDSLMSMYRSDVYGAEWHNNSTDCICAMINSVAFADSMNGFGVGVNGKMVRTYNGGLDWPIGSSPIDRDFSKVIYVNQQTLIVVGGNEANSRQTILKSTNGGNTWNVVFDTMGPILKSAYFIDTVKGFAVGDTGTILGTIDGGGTWQAINAPVQRDFNAIAFINADTGYITGGLGGANAMQTVMQTVNGGTLWTVLRDQPGACLKDVSFSDAGNGYMVGDSAVFLKSTDGGQSWNQNIVAGTTGLENFTSVYFKNPGFGVIGSKQGGVYIYTTIPVPVVRTYAAIFSSGPSLALGALINTYGFPVEASFIYSADSTLTTPIFASPFVFISDTSSLKTSNASGLLSTPGTYYFACKVTTLLGDFYGDTLSFVVRANPAQLNCFPCTNTTVNSTTLNATASGLPVPSNMYFEYVNQYDSSVFTVPASPAAIADTLSHNLIANVSGLIPYAPYTSRLKAVHDNSIMYSSTLNFATTTSTAMINAFAAKNVTTNSATLPGQIGSLPFNAHVWFEYWIYNDTVIHTVSGNPATINAGGNYSDSAVVTGLIPYSFYQYRIKVVDSFHTAYSGGGNNFYTGQPNTLVADSATNVGLYGATVHGHTTGLHFPANIYFYYWYAGMPYARVPANPATISDTLNHTISANLSGLIPYKQYFYALYAIDTPNLIQSNPSNFFTTPANQAQVIVLTQSATGITATSAVLNGIVGNLQLPGTVSFEYWLSGGVHNSVAAVPATISDSLVYPVTASLSLNPNSLYLYRVKVTGQFGTIYGDSLDVFNGANTIPNFDFENWSIATGELPDGWANIYGPLQKVNPGANGSNLAVKLLSSYIGVGAMFNAVFLNSDNQNLEFFGGMPYNARPDTFSGMFNYNILTGDTAYVLVEFKSNAQVLSQQFFPVTGNSASAFQRLTFPLSYSSGATPDTVILGFLPSNPFANNGVRGSSMTIDDISFGQTNPAIPNAGFENWTSFSFKKLEGWTYTDMTEFGIYSNPDSQCVLQASDAWHGNYAAEVGQTFTKGNQGTINGDMSTSPRATNGNGGPSFPLNHQPLSFNGYYKFFPQGADTLRISCSFYKDGITIGEANFVTTQQALLYTPFNIHCNYGFPSMGPPDSANIEVMITAGAANALPKALIDYLYFDGYISAIDEPAIAAESYTPAIRIYPNPANNSLTVEYLSESPDKDFLRICDLSGRVLYQTESGGTAGLIKKDIDVSQLASGIYLVTMQANTSISTGKFVLQH